MKTHLGLYIDDTYHQYEAWTEDEKYYVSPYGKTQWGEDLDNVFGPYTKEQFEAKYYVSEYE